MVILSVFPLMDVRSTVVYFTLVQYDDADNGKSCEQEDDEGAEV